MLTRLTYLFPLWAVLFSILAYLAPEPFVRSRSLIVPLRRKALFAATERERTQMGESFAGT